MGSTIKLGDKVVDTVAGFSGTCTAICYYLTGPSRAEVTPGANLDGSFSPERWVDVERLKVAES